MNKKDYVIQILQKLSPHLKIATFLLSLVAQGITEEKDLDDILKVIDENLHLIKDESSRTKFQQAIQTIKNIHQQEEKEKTEEMKELDELLKNIESI